MSISPRMLLGGVACIVLAAGLTACANSSKTSASPGVVGSKDKACCSESAKASPAELGAKKSGCCSEAGKASPGVMSTEKSGACPAGAGSCSGTK